MQIRTWLRLVRPINNMLIILASELVIVYKN